MPLAEALLERHFRPALLGALERAFRRPARRVLCPSKDGSHLFSGRSAIGLQRFMDTLAAPETNDLTYVILLLDFRFLEPVSKRGERLPTGFTSPYYRVPLPLGTERRVSPSPHETLRELGRLASAPACYALPRIDSADALTLAPTFDVVDLIPLVPLTVAARLPAIVYQDLDGEPLYSWSTLPAVTLPFDHWLPKRALDADETLKRLLDLQREASLQQGLFDGDSPLPATTTIVEFGRPDDFETPF